MKTAPFQRAAFHFSTANPRFLLSPSRARLQGIQPESSVMTVRMNARVTAAMKRLQLDRRRISKLKKAYDLSRFHYRLSREAMAETDGNLAHLAALQEIVFFSRRAVVDLVELPSEYSEQLSNSVSRYASLGRQVPLTDLFLAISAGINEMVECLKPPQGRRPNLALERAVRTLLPAIEEVTGQPARIRWNKGKGTAPESGSFVTEVLVTMLKSFDDRLTDVSIFNMIGKVRTKPERIANQPRLPRPSKASGLM